MVFTSTASDLCGSELTVQPPTESQPLTQTLSPDFRPWEIGNGNFYTYEHPFLQGSPCFAITLR